MTSLTAQEESLPAMTTDDDDVIDTLTIGRRIRQLRTERRMTLDDLAAAVDRAPSQLSMIVY